jgi:diguanylate cyclase (GGDEF)-like protein/PAS domain S-box-containing protein
MHDNGATSHDLKDENAAQRQYQEQLEREAAVGRSLLRQFPQGGAMLVFDHDLRYLATSIGQTATGNLNYEYLRGNTIYEALPPETCSRIEPHYRAALRGETSGFQTTFDGRIYDVHVQPVHDTQEQVVAGLALVNDITERLNAECALRESEGRLQAALYGSNDGVWDWDYSSGTVYFSDRWQEMLGYTPGEVVGHVSTWEKLVHPDDMPHVVETLQAHLEGRSEVYCTEHRCRAKDGSWKWILDRGRVVSRDAAGQPLRVVGTHSDITERKEIEAALRESEARYRRLTENAPDLIYRIRLQPSKSFEYVSPASTAIIGYTPEEHYADPDLALKLIHPDDLYILDKIARGEQPFDEPLEIRWVAKDGRVVWIEQRNTPIFDETGALIAIEGVARDITERREMDAALRENQILLQNVVDHMPATVFVKDKQSHYLLINHYFENLLRLSRDQVIGYTNSELVPLHLEQAGLQPGSPEAAHVEQIAAGWDAEDQAVLARGEMMQIEETAPVAGEPRSFVSIKFPVRNAAGAIIGIGGISTDITERRRAEESLRASEETYRLLSENSRDMICLHDADGTYRYISQSVRDLLGYEPAELLGTSPYALFHPDDHEAIMRESHKVALENRLNHSIEYRIRRKDGSYIWFETYTRPICDDSGEVMQLQTASRDVTERKRAEDALRVSQAQMQAILDNTLIGMALLDTNWTYLQINDRWASMLGYTVEEVYQGSTLDVTHPDDVEVSRMHQQLLARGEIDHYRLEKRFVRKDSGIIWCDVLVRLIRNEQGAPALIVGTAADVTTRRAAEEALRESNRRTVNILESITDAFFALDTGYHFTYINQRAAAILQRSQDELIGKNVWQEFPEAVQLAFYDQYRYAMEHHETVSFEAFFPPLATWFDVRAYPSLDGLSVYFHDITARKNEEVAQQHWIDELQRRNDEISLLNEMSDLLQTCRTDEEAATIIRQVVPQFFPNLVGALYIISASRVHAEALTSWGVLEMPRVCSPDECWALRRGRVHLVQPSRAGLICQHLPRPLPETTLCVPMMAQGEMLGMLNLCSVVGSLSEAQQQLAVTVSEHLSLALSNVRLRETLRHQAIRDPLTGMYNRRYMEESLERELRRAARHGTPLGVMMLDLDHFKRFNDTFGHAAGDVVLREVGHLLQHYLRGEDIACRYGGEEFTLILIDAPLSVVVQRANQIREAVKALTISHHGQSLGIASISLGVAMFPEHGLTSEKLVRSADAALYRAKEAGRDRVIVVQALPEDH